MQAMAAGELPPPPIAETLGFRLVEAEPGHAVFECEPAEYHYNPIGIVHAGLAMTLMDSAMGLAFVTTLAEPAGLDDARGEVELHARADRRHRHRALYGLGRPSGPAGGDDGGEGRGRAGAALRARDEHDPRPLPVVALAHATGRGQLALEPKRVGRYAEDVRRDRSGTALSPVSGRRRTA